MRGRMIRFTTKRPGMYSNSSVMSSPSVFSDSPQALHSVPGESISSLRGRWSGKGLRFGLPFGLSLDVSEISEATGVSTARAISSS